jgi:putative spermidine/putrescine transport system ATP-binding protein
MSDRGNTSVEFQDVRRVFGATTALDGLSLRIEPGELLALLGPSGCGKTTALRLLAGFDRPTSGAVLLDGKDISGVPAARRDMGMVFQSYSLFPTMTALENVAFGLKIRRAATSTRLARSRELLDLVGLGEHAKKFPHQLSGGQQQRVALARALAVEPKVLLLDEPLSALDAKVREQLRDEIRRIQTELGVTTVMVTHDQEEALSMADRVGVMRAGRLEQCAAPADLYQRPATAFVAEFVGTMNRVAGVVEEGGKVRVLGRTVLASNVAERHPASGESAEVLVRPEALVVTADEVGAWTVVTAAFRGATVRLHLEPSGGDAGSRLVADIAAHRAAEVTAGARVQIALMDGPVLLA